MYDYLLMKYSLKQVRDLGEVTYFIYYSFASFEIPEISTYSNSKTEKTSCGILEILKSSFFLLIFFIIRLLYRKDFPSTHLVFAFSYCWNTRITLQISYTISSNTVSGVGFKSLLKEKTISCCIFSQFLALLKVFVFIDL